MSRSSGELIVRARARGDAHGRKVTVPSLSMMGMWSVSCAASLIHCHTDHSRTPVTHGDTGGSVPIGAATDTVSPAAEMASTARAYRVSERVVSEGTIA